MQESQPSPLQQVESSMLSKARDAVLRDGHWLTAEQVGALARFDEGSASTQLAKWLGGGQMFAVNHQGIDYFPAFGFDQQDSFRPLTSMAKVIETLGQSKDGWGLAYWFASSNSFLGGRRPQDLLAVDPEAVVAAAMDELSGALHG